MDGFDLGGIELPEFDELDFNIGDFDVIGSHDALETQVFQRPRYHKSRPVMYEHAEEFARELDISDGMDVFAFVSGNFIFGDFIEALVDLGKLSVRRLGIQTLSMSEDNIDSIRNILEMQPVERLDMIVSDYWYSHERRNLVPYLYEQVDLEWLDLHIAYASIHTKIVTIETLDGMKLYIYGSANLRSSRNVEQLEICADRCLYDFMTGFSERVIAEYDVVNHDERRKRSLRGGKLWQAARGQAVGSQETRRPRSADASSGRGRTRIKP